MSAVCAFGGIGVPHLSGGLSVGAHVGRGGPEESSSSEGGRDFRCDILN